MRFIGGIGVGGELDPPGHIVADARRRGIEIRIDAVTQEIFLGPDSDDSAPLLYQRRTHLVLDHLRRRIVNGCVLAGAVKLCPSAL